MEPNQKANNTDKNKINENKNSFNEKVIKLDLKFNMKFKNAQTLNKLESHEVNSNININTINNPNVLNMPKEKEKEKNLIDDFEISDGIYDDFNNLDLSPAWKSDIIKNEIEVDLLDIISISTPTKKAKKEYMKSFMSTLVYNGVTFKDKLNDSTNKTIILYDNIIKNFNINSMKNYFVYMSYRNGLINTKFLPGYKNDYTSDCGWGCMVRCCQMMLSRAFIKLKLNILNKSQKK